MPCSGSDHGPNTKQMNAFIAENIERDKFHIEGINLEGSIRS